MGDNISYGDIPPTQSTISSGEISLTDSLGNQIDNHTDIDEDYHLGVSVIQTAMIDDE